MNDSVFSSDDLPLTLIDLTQFESTEFSLLFSNDYSPGIVAFDAKVVSGQMTNLIAVPLPPSIPSFLLSMIGLMFSKKKY